MTGVEKKNDGWKVFFAFDRQDPSALECPQPCVLINPWERGWNDFGFKTDCDIRVFGLGEVVELKGKVAFKSMRGSVHLHLQNAFNRSERRKDGSRSGWTYLTHEDVPDFYTMLIDVESYRKLLRAMGMDVANQALKALNDMALAKAKRSKAKWFIEAQRERAFTESFIRSAETFFAFHSASFLIDGLEEERLDAVSSRLELKFLLEGYTSPHQFHFNFSKDSVIPRNIAVVIGRNGVGKSQTLSRLVKAALQNDLATLREPGGSRPMISRILAMATPGETAHTFPAPLRSKRQRINYRRMSLARGSTGTGADGLPDLVNQLSRRSDGIRNKERWTLFIDAIKTVMDVNTIAFRLYPSEENDEPHQYYYHFEDASAASLTDFVAGGEGRRLELRRRLVLNEPPKIYLKGKLYPMSSGQIAFFRFALHACLYIENGTLVLLDEPETHLHPNLISDFVMLLNTLLAETGSISIISTHSAYFVREVPRSQVFILRSTAGEDGKTIFCDRPRLGTFGSNVGAISHFVFEDELNTCLMQLVQGNINANSLEQIKDEISLESYIKVRDRLRKSVP